MYKSHGDHFGHLEEQSRMGCVGLERVDDGYVRYPETAPDRVAGAVHQIDQSCGLHDDRQKDFAGAVRHVH